MGDQSNFSAQHVGKLGTGFELLLLRNLNRTHHFHRVFVKEILSFNIELTIVNKKTVDVFGSRFGAREKSEERTRFCRGIPARKLRRDSFRYAEDVSAVSVNIFHQRFAAEQPAHLRITQPLCHRLLHVEMQNVGRAMVQIMELRADAQKEIVGRFDAAPIRFA